MVSLLYRIFGKRTGRIISGIIFLIAGLIFLMLNLSDTPLPASNSDWFYCTVLILAGIVFLALGLFNRVRPQPAQMGHAPVVQQPYAQWPQQPGGPQQQSPL